MCTQCQSGSPQSQVQALVNWVRGKGVRFGMLWFDVESCDGCWSSESENANFIAAAVQEARSMGVNVGIYSSHYEWGLVMGDWAGLSGYPCWYADYDGATNFNDFEAYGGWSRPSIKQYDGDVSVCGLDLDEDWYPDSLDALPPFYNATAASV
jgi:GH25 family lysozyme M1 (1,4-beta-N-acetylmuramidase)